MSTEPQTDRRTLMKVGAWSVPVIALAAATPAAAASTAEPYFVTSSSGLKFPTADGIRVDIIIYISATDGSIIPPGTPAVFTIGEVSFSATNSRSDTLGRWRLKNAEFPYPDATGYTVTLDGWSTYRPFDE